MMRGGAWCCLQVFKGRCKLFNEIVAIKRLDLDMNWDLVRTASFFFLTQQGTAVLAALGLAGGSTA